MRETMTPEASLNIGLVMDDGMGTDGVQQYTVAMGELFRSQGHTVHYITGQSPETDLENVHSMARNLRVPFAGNRMGVPVHSSARQIQSLLDVQQFDVLHVQMPYSPVMAGKVIKQASAETAVVGTFHILPFSALSSRGNKLLGKVLRPTLGRFDEIISVSSAAQEFAKQAYGVKSQVIPNAVDVAHFAAGRRLPEFADSKTIVFLGRLVPRKGCQELLQALHYLRAHHAEALADTKVVVCGKGELEAKLKKYVADNGLDDIVQFEGFVSEAKKPDYLASADIAVFPSLGGESFGIVLLEAMAAGADVVLGGDNPGYKTVLGEKPELLLNPRSPAAFARKLAFLLQNPEACQVLHAWQDKTIGQYDIAIVGAQVLEVYRQAIAKRRVATHNSH